VCVCASENACHDLEISTLPVVLRPLHAYV